MVAWQPLPKEQPIKKLSDYELQQLMIIKQAITKSLLEAGTIKERNAESEKIIEDWIQFVYRNEEKDFKLAKVQELPF